MEKENIFVSRATEKPNCYSMNEYSKFLVALSEYNIGGVPLHFLAGSSWFVSTNCELLGKWFASVVPEGNYVEGTLAHYKKLAEQSEEEPYKWAGFHVWIEYTDPETKEEKVLDPCSHRVFNKEYFYKNEGAEVTYITPCNIVTDYLVKYKPTKNLNSSDYDFIRLAILMKHAKFLLKSEFGFFKNILNEKLKEFIKQNKLKKVLQNYEKENSNDLPSAYNKLFTDKLDEDTRFEEQVHILSQIIDRLENLEKLGFITKDGKIEIPQSELKNMKQID